MPDYQIDNNNDSGDAQGGFLEPVVDWVKGTYFYWEDKWYNTLDKIDTKIPVYKVVDTVPRGCVKVTDFTQIVLKEKPVKGELETIPRISPLSNSTHKLSTAFTTKSDDSNSTHRFLISKTLLPDI